MKKRKIAIICSISLVAFLAISCGITACFIFFVHYHGKEIEDVWTRENNFSLNDIPTLNKEEGKEFKILNFTDIQLYDLDSLKNTKIIHDEIKYLVDLTKPDLITLTGDQVWFNFNFLSVKRIIRWFDDLEIPWAPVFGNHDSGDEYNSAVFDTLKMCELYEESEYCLFSRGPSNLGTYGNYLVNIKENNKIINTLYFIDSGVAEKISTNQIDWVAWNCDKICENNGEYARNLAFMHKPIPEFALAYFFRESDENVYQTFSLSGSKQNGFFNMASSRNFTDIICGHQHGNNFTLPYGGINMTFAVKTGQNSSYYCGDDVNLNGATLISIGDQITTTHIHLEKDQFNFE